MTKVSFLGGLSLSLSVSWSINNTCKCNKIFLKKKVFIHLPLVRQILQDFVMSERSDCQYLQRFPGLTTFSVRQDVWGSSEKHLRSLGSDHDSLENCISQNGLSTSVIQENLTVILPNQDVIYFDPHLRMELATFVLCYFSFCTYVSV